MGVLLLARRRLEHTPKGEEEREGDEERKIAENMVRDANKCYFCGESKNIIDERART